MSFGRSTIRGPRFGFENREGCCEKCVFGNGEHADWCIVRKSQSANAEKSQPVETAEESANT